MLSKTTTSASVGRNAINKPVDVALIQDLLSRAGHFVAVNGSYDAIMLSRIRAFQSKSGFLHPDGVVSPHGPTLAKLLKSAGRFYAGPDFWRQYPSVAWWKTRPRVFTGLFALQFPNVARVVNWTIPRPAGLGTVFTSLC
jgi:peptidoglycan hydrolase-like protein with peptidoglycan-binding domain